MSPIALGASVSALATAADDSHFPPSPADFWQPMFSIGPVVVTRPMLTALLSLVVLSVWLVLTTRRAAVVPGKAQWVTEGFYNFVRNNIARDMVGSKEFMRFVPLLFALFMFILLNNLFGIIPGIQMPTMARIGFPIALTLIVYVVYHWVGIRRKGLSGYLKGMVPPGLPPLLVPVIFLLELVTYFITRPLTLALRLFGNMFAGHMLLVVFIVGGWELFTSGNLFYQIVAFPSWILGAVMTVFELLVQVLQAFVFTLLAASYIGGALADEH